MAASLSTNAMALDVDSRAMKAFLQTRASVITFLRHSRYHLVRPQVGFVRPQFDLEHHCNMFWLACGQQMDMRGNNLKVK